MRHFTRGKKLRRAFGGRSSLNGGVALDFGSRWGANNQCDFALHALFRIAAGKFFRGDGSHSAKDFFMAFRELATHRNLSRGEHLRDNRKRIGYAARAFIEHERGIEARKSFEHCLALAGLAREKPAEIVARVGKTAGDISRRSGRCARQHLIGRARGLRRRNKTRPRIRHARHAGIAAKCDALASQNALDNAISLLGDGRFIEPLEPLFNIEVREQLARDARVFRAYHIGRAQLIERAQRDIAQVADGRGA